MEKNQLKEQKLNIIDIIQKRLIIRRLRKNKEIDSWKQIKNPKIKYDQEIMDLAWENLFLTNNEEGYKEFPKDMQLKKGSSNSNIIALLDDEVQRLLAEQNKSMINNCSEEVRESLVLSKPQEYLEIVSYNERERLVLKNHELIKFYSNQYGLVQDNPTLILYCSNDIKKRILAEKNILSEEWQIILTNEPNLTINKLIKCFHNSASSLSQEKGQVLADFLNTSSDKKEIIIQIKELDTINIEEILNYIRR